MRKKILAKIMRKKILAKRQLLEIDTPSKNAVYLAAKLINQFCVFVDEPQMLSNDNIKTIADFFSESIPSGFYKNPQEHRRRRRISPRGSCPFRIFREARGRPP